MTLLDLLKSDAEYAYAELLKSIEGVTEPQAWTILPNNGPDYLHTDGSIQGIVLHICSTRWAYASICFRNTEIRWRDIADQMEQFEPSWDKAIDYLKRGHEYWMASWANIEDLNEMRPTNWKEDRPAWQILQIASQHDSYHAGQIALLRYAVGDSQTPPPPYAEDIRKYCQDSKHW